MKNRLGAAWYWGWGFGYKGTEGKVANYGGGYCIELHTHTHIHTMNTCITGDNGIVQCQFSSFNIVL